MDLIKLAALSHRWRFAQDSCFLCGRSLTRYGSSSEHVVPRWAQRRYDLWDEEMTLLNGTAIPYRQLTIPCCEECNKYRLQPIETIVCQATERGSEAVRALPERVLFLWLGKVLYGLLYRELSLAADRSDPESPSIVSPKLLAVYGSHLYLLQQARDVLEVLDFSPGSIFVFATQQPDSVQLQWDLCDNIDSLSIGVRMGGVGLIGALGDGGAMKIEMQAYQKFGDLHLHPLQFRELCAAIFYQSTLANRVPKRVTVQAPGQKAQMFQLPLARWSLKPLFDDWSNEEFAVYLAKYLRLPLTEVRRPTGEVLTYVWGPDGEPQYLPYDVGQ